MKKSDVQHTVPQPTEHKVESLTALAVGMADEFNNILTTVMGACSLIVKDDPVNKELLKYVALIRSSAEHAAELSDKLVIAGCIEQKSEKNNSASTYPKLKNNQKRDKNASNDIVSSNKLS